MGQVICSVIIAVTVVAVYFIGARVERWWEDYQGRKAVKKIDETMADILTPNERRSMEGLKKPLVDFSKDGQTARIITEPSHRHKWKLHGEVGDVYTFRCNEFYIQNGWKFRCGEFEDVHYEVFWGYSNPGMWPKTVVARNHKFITRELDIDRWRRDHQSK